MKLSIITPIQFRASVRQLKANKGLRDQLKALHLRPLEAATMLRFHARHIFRPTAYHIEHKHLDKYVLQRQAGSGNGLSLHNQTRLALYCLKQLGPVRFAELNARTDEFNMESARLFIGSTHEDAFSEAFQVIGSAQHRLKFLNRDTWARAHAVLSGELLSSEIMSAIATNEPITRVQA